MKYWSKFALGEWTTKLLFLCLATDAGFISVHIIRWRLGLLDNPLFSIENDRGYAEVFQYIKEYWIVLLLGLTALQKRSLLYLSWASLFFYVLLDDSLSTHERLGEFMAVKFALPALLGLRTVDLGELIVSASVGMLFFVCIAASYQFGDSRFRKVSQRLISLMLSLVFFGIGVDMVHGALSYSKISDLLGLIEDGGEMLVMSAIICFVFSSLESPQAETRNAVKLRENLKV